MSETYQLLAWFSIFLLLLYFVMWLVVPRKWLFSLPLLIYAVATVFITDTLRLRYGGGTFVSLLDVSAGIAITFVILLPLIEGVLRLCLTPFVRANEARSRITDAAYWFAAGLIIPFIFLQTRVFLILRRRGALRNMLLLLSGYSLGMSIMLAVSLYCGIQVSSGASALAQDALHCVRSDARIVTSILDMTPLTLISRGIFEYHAELIVEAKPKARSHNWSWQNLTFTPIPPDRMHSDSCSEL